MTCIRKYDHKIKITCILEADETERLRIKGIEPRIHEDHIAGKGDNSLHHYSLVHMFIPMPQAMKIQAAKEAVDKEWRKLKKSSAWNPAKVRNKSVEVTLCKTIQGLMQYSQGKVHKHHK